MKVISMFNVCMFSLCVVLSIVNYNIMTTLGWICATMVQIGWMIDERNGTKQTKG